MRLALAAILAFSASTAYAGPTEEVLYRQTLMHSAGNKALLLNAILEGRLGRPGDVKALGASLSADGALLEAAFKGNPQGAQVPTKALPKIWEPGNDFSKKLGGFAGSIRELGKLASAGKTADAQKLLKDRVAPACKACHQDYKDK